MSSCLVHCTVTSSTKLSVRSAVMCSRLTEDSVAFSGEWLKFSILNSLIVQCTDPIQYNIILSLFLYNFTMCSILQCILIPNYNIYVNLFIYCYVYCLVLIYCILFSPACKHYNSRVFLQLLWNRLSKCSVINLW